MVLLSLILVFGVIFVNGWTDAPNSIATAISSGAIEYKKATILCGIFNFLGVFLGSFIDTSVAKYVFSLTDLTNYSSLIVCVSLFCMIVYGTVLSFFGLPSSESHAMISCILGCSFYLSKDIKNIKNLGEVFIFTVFSCLIAFVLSYLVRKIFKWNLNYKKLQYLSCSLNATMHGYQSGLKFLGIILFLLGSNFNEKHIFIPLSFLVGIFLFLGALLGGKKIISSMGDNLTTIDNTSSFCSDISTYLSLLVSSFFGMPVSTGNIKCLSILGIAFKEKRKINKKTTIKLFVSFIIVFPICFLFGYFLVGFFVSI